jgi:hypothetical protein
MSAKFEHAAGRARRHFLQELEEALPEVRRWLC